MAALQRNNTYGIKGGAGIVPAPPFLHGTVHRATLDLHSRLIFANRANLVKIGLYSRSMFVGVVDGAEIGRL